MYLVTLALLHGQEQPVPLSLLAQNLAVSPVSVNEMCRKLTERGLIEYQPYKGATLTFAGRAIAQHILDRRRLWEVFLVKKLQMEAVEAEDLACRLEHITSDNLMERLALFLGKPLSWQAQLSRSLATLTAGQRGQILNIGADAQIQNFLQAQGVAVGLTVEVLALAMHGSFLLKTATQNLVLSQEIATQIEVFLLNEQESATFQEAPYGFRA